MNFQQFGCLQSPLGSPALFLHGLHECSTNSLVLKYCNRRFKHDSLNCLIGRRPCYGKCNYLSLLKDSETLSSLSSINKPPNDSIKLKQIIKKIKVNGLWDLKPCFMVKLLSDHDFYMNWRKLLTLQAVTLWCWWWGGCLFLQRFLKLAIVSFFRKLVYTHSSSALLCFIRDKKHDIWTTTRIWENLCYRV